MTIARIALLLGLSFALAGCGGSGPAAPAPSPSASGGAASSGGAGVTAGAGATGATVVAIASPVATASPAGAAIDPTRIPSGDGKVSGTTPAIGSIYSCTTTFNGMGAQGAGPWINADGSWNALTKIAVLGTVAWPTAAFSSAVNGATRQIVSNDLPNHATGSFPIGSSDPAYAFDRNPNAIGTKSISYTLPQMPTANGVPTCVGLGAIGIMNSGTVLYDALDAVGRDAAEHEMQDGCHGHPDPSSTYHYHDLSTCIADPGTGHSNLLGYARDGFGIYGNRGQNGEALVNANLDVCHGHTHAITWDGATVVLYHYHATKEYPYTVGCYRGTPQ